MAGAKGANTLAGDPGVKKPALGYVLPPVSNQLWTLLFHTQDTLLRLFTYRHSALNGNIGGE